MPRSPKKQRTGNCAIIILNSVWSMLKCVCWTIFKNGRAIFSSVVRTVFFSPSKLKLLQFNPQFIFTMIRNAILFIMHDSRSTVRLRIREVRIRNGRQHKLARIEEGSDRMSSPHECFYAVNNNSTLDPPLLPSDSIFARDYRWDFSEAIGLAMGDFSRKVSYSSTVPVELQ